MTACRCHAYGSACAIAQADHERFPVMKLRPQSQALPGKHLMSPAPALRCAARPTAGLLRGELPLSLLRSQLPWGT